MRPSGRRRSEVLGEEFGEKVLWTYHTGKTMEQLNARRGYGSLLGLRPRCWELIVVDGAGRTSNTSGP
jgi:hypothetical protein